MFPMLPGQGIFDKIKLSHDDPGKFFACNVNYPKCIFDFTHDQQYLKPYDDFVFRCADRPEDDESHII